VFSATVGVVLWVMCVMGHERCATFIFTIIVANVDQYPNDDDDDDDDLIWLVGWLVGWLFGWLVGWLVGWLTDYRVCS